MRILLFLSIWSILASCQSSGSERDFSWANNMVVAHRGAWKTNKLPQNSLASLRQAIKLKCIGSEFDVRMTADDILIVTHDADYSTLKVEESTYAELSKFKLQNGEILPTLEQYIIEGMRDNNSTGLVCEIKPSGIAGRNEIIAEKVLQLVDHLNAGSYILCYISFSYDILEKLQELAPDSKTQYLDGSKTPIELKKAGISGLDYHLGKFKEKPEWIGIAKDIGLNLNAWTVNDVEDIDWLLDNDFDYITTDEPELVLERIQESPTYHDWELVWSDEFDYSGKPDSSKWTLSKGFISNQEEQYFTDKLENARVEKGKLVLEVHKEKISNEKYKSEEFNDKSWLKYIAEIDTAKYTSARLETKGLASWKYGYIEVKALLPKGLGLWPAIWMLGDNMQKVGWPESGEIDIMEHVGYNPDSIFGTIHSEAYNHMKGSQKGKKIFIKEPYDKFHVFGIEWTAEKIDFLLDGEVYNHIENEYKTTAEWPFDQNFYLIMNVSVGGMLGGKKGIDENIFPQQMIIDYVRVFQK